MEDHTYFVGEHGVLVHNKCDGSGLDDFDKKFKNASEKISNKVSSVDGKSYATGYDGEKALADLVGGESQVYKSTSMGGRYIDQMADGIAHESKVGRTSLSRRVKKQILKDAELMATGEIEGAHWHFFRSGVTGKIGGTQPLLDYLTEKGIPYTIHY